MSEIKPVAAQHRFRHPQKTMPDWSKWQESEIDLGRKSYEVDSQGCEVEYRLLYQSIPDTHRIVSVELLESAVIATYLSCPEISLELGTIIDKEEST
jgi:hypothetical protein